MVALDGVSHVMLYVADVGRASAWYQKQLGFTQNFSADGMYASLRHDQLGLRLDLHHTEAGSPNLGHGPVLYFRVTDMDGALRAFREAGARTDEARQEGSSPRFAHFWDSEGNSLGLEEATQRH